MSLGSTFFTSTLFVDKSGVNEQSTNLETGNYNELIKMKKSKRSEDKYEIDFLLTGVHKKRYPLFKPPSPHLPIPPFYGKNLKSLF